MISGNEKIDPRAEGNASNRMSIEKQSVPLIVHLGYRTLAFIRLSQRGSSPGGGDNLGQ